LLFVRALALFGLGLVAFEGEGFGHGWMWVWVGDKCEVARVEKRVPR
jgi:hypothetical protein